METPRLLFIGLVWPEPQSSAAGSRSLQLLSLFAAKGYAITVASAAQNRDFSIDWAAYPYTFHPIAVNDTAFDDWVKTLQPDVVIFDRFVTEEQFGWRVREQCPQAFTLLDSQDLHFLRAARQQAVKKQVPLSRSLLLSDTAKRELAAFYRCDWVLVISAFEYEWLQNEWQFPAAQLVYLPLFGEKGTSIPDFTSRADFVFMGNFMHDPNSDAVLLLKEVLWPKIRRQLPHAQLRIYGAYTSERIQQMHQPAQGFLCLGRAPEALATIASAKVMLAPLRFGAGIKGKLLEAMQMGTPTVTTPIGAEGMHHDGLWNGVITDDWDVFVAAAVNLYTNALAWTTAQEQGFVLLQQQFSAALHTDRFWSRWDLVRTQLEQHREANVVGQLLNHHTLQSTRYLSKWISEKNKT
ncbi:glycosyltransferase [Flavobacterium sp.]|uniref:glycosyltransferase n=1 Tax=Flavobacterium sp. TaxID=239 RepID=UPI0033423EB2